MSLAKLRLSIIGTLAFIIGISTLFFAALLNWLGAFSGASGLWTLIIFVVGFNLVQWLIAPHLIGAMYRIREIGEPEQPRLYSTVRAICQRTGLKMPKLMLANMGVPNAFAYGSPLTGNRVAVTTGLLQTLQEEEVEAVLGHELGHLKNRDVQIMMFASVLPSIFYFIGYSLMLSSWYGGSRSRNNSGAAVLVGFAAMALYSVLSLFVLGLSRLREYYADQHAVRHVSDGGRKLSEALAKIVTYTGLARRGQKGNAGNASFKTLFVSDPDTASKDIALLAQAGFAQSDRELVAQVMGRKITSADRLIELFSTHPNIVKRLRAIRAPSR